MALPLSTLAARSQLCEPHTMAPAPAAVHLTPLATHTTHKTHKTHTQKVRDNEMTADAHPADALPGVLLLTAY